jgi:hypothetical protein
MTEMLDLSGWTSRKVCGLCTADAMAIPTEVHHKKFRSQQEGNEPGNLILLCKACHDAVHGIPSNLNGHSCETCPVLAQFGCFFGEKVTGSPVVTPKPW